MFVLIVDEKDIGINNIFDIIIISFGRSTILKT